MTVTMVTRRSYTSFLLDFQSHCQTRSQAPLRASLTFPTSPDAWRETGGSRGGEAHSLDHRYRRGTTDIYSTLSSPLNTFPGTNYTCAHIHLPSLLLWTPFFSSVPPPTPPHHLHYRHPLLCAAPQKAAAASLPPTLDSESEDLHQNWVH